MRGALAAAIVLTACGCNPQLQMGWVDPHRYSREVGPFGDAPAEVLYQGERLYLYADRAGNYTQLQKQVVLSIRSEAGVGLAEQRFIWPKDAEVEELRVRRTDPDGTVEELSEAQLLALSTESQEGGGGFHARVFRVPRVKVGSLIEWTLMLEIPYLLVTLEGALGGSLPVRRADVEIISSPGIRHSLKVYNSLERFTLARDGTFARTNLTLRNIEAFREEPWGPVQSLAVPWWVYRFDQFISARAMSEDASTWQAILKRWAEAVYGLGGPLYQGFSLALVTDGCGADPACLVKRALERVGKIEGDGFGPFFDVRPLQEVVASGRGTRNQKALILRRLLADAQVEAHLAGLIRPLSDVADLGFPSHTQLNHQLVFVPAQRGLPKPLWLDPSCDHCAPGELPYWSRGEEALVYTDPDDEVAPRRVRTQGTVPLEAVLSEAFEVVLDETGRAKVGFALEARGEEAALRRDDFRKLAAEKLQRFAENFVSKRAPTARDITVKLDGCRAGVCRASGEFVVPSLAHRDGDRLLVPLTLLGGGDVNRVSGERRHGVFVSRPRCLEDVVTVHAPAGYSGVVPGASIVESAAFSARSSFTPVAGGIEVRRELVSHLGAHPRSEWPQIARAVEAFQEVRQVVLTFEATGQPR